MEASDFKVEVVTIDDIVPHPNADKLLIAKVKGWQSIIPKDKFKVGDKAVYIPVDSLLPPELEAKLFGVTAKIKLHGGRVRAIKIRQFISQGMVESFENLGLTGFLNTAVGKDVGAELGITKYEPPAPAFQGAMGQSSPASKKKQNPNFTVYTKFPRIQNYPNIFAPDEEVIVTEKIHGTNFRAGWVPFAATNWRQRLLKLLRLAPKWQFVYGSHYTQLSDKLLYNGYYEKNVYAEMVKKYSLETCLPKGMVVYGEIYGAGIQKGYDYGLKDSRDLVVFDIKQMDKYADYEVFKIITEIKELPTPPVLYRGPFNGLNLDEIVKGNSVLAPTQKVREGVVVKPLIEGDLLPRKGAKVISPEYLIGDNTDFH